MQGPRAEHCMVREPNMAPDYHEFGPAKAYRLNVSFFEFMNWVITDCHVRFETTFQPAVFAKYGFNEQLA
jgi:hypothetical protein